MGEPLRVDDNRRDRCRRRQSGGVWTTGHGDGVAGQTRFV
jgi:hypothetical protein